MVLELLINLDWIYTVCWQVWYAPGCCKPSCKHSPGSCRGCSRFGKLLKIPTQGLVEVIGVYRAGLLTRRLRSYGSPGGFKNFRIRTWPLLSLLGSSLCGAKRWSWDAGGVFTHFSKLFYWTLNFSHCLPKASYSCLVVGCQGHRILGLVSQLVSLPLLSSVWQWFHDLLPSWSLYMCGWFAPQHFDCLPAALLLEILLPKLATYSPACVCQISCRSIMSGQHWSGTSWCQQYDWSRH